MSELRLKHGGAGITRRELLKGAATLPALVMFGSFFKPSTAKAQDFDTVSIKEMKRWNEETKKYRVLGSGRTKEGYATLVKVTFNGEVFLATGFIDFTGKKGQKMSFEYKSTEGKIRHYKDLDLSKLAKLYEKQTGKKFTSFDIVVEKGKDDKVGDYIQFWAVPNGEIKPGVPVLAAYGYAQGNVGTSSKPDLLAYAK